MYLFKFPQKLVLFVLLCTTTLFSQEREFVTGRLVDSKTEEPVVFATLRVKNKAVGVISNMDGTFRVPLALKTFGDTLEISSLGYASRDILLFQLAQDKINLIKLDPAVELLDEVEVQGTRISRKRVLKEKRMSAAKIVRMAIKRIPFNYPTDAFSLVGYYRDYQLAEGDYFNLNEAILEVVDQGFDESDYETTKVRIYDYRKNNDFRRDTLPQQPYDYIDGRKIINEAYLPNYGGNEFTILRIHDALRNFNVNSYSFVNRMDTDFIKNHDFSKDADVYFDDIGMYTIALRKTFPDHIAYGTLHISKHDFAIYQMEYGVYHRRRKLPKGQKNKYGNNRQLLFEVRSEYQRKNGKMYLNFISFYNGFRVRQPPKLKVDDINVNISKKCFVITFNTNVNEKEAFQDRNYNVRYKGKKLKFDRIVHIENEVLLYPKMEAERGDLMFKEIESVGRRKMTLNKEVLYFDIKGIRDLEGNRIDKRSYKEFEQFREFFVQQVKPGNFSTKDNLYMKKNAPIFKDQPMARPDNFSDYWMNTPLSTVDNEKRP